MTRVEELTLRLLDGVADAAERDELARIVAADEKARGVHLMMMQVEGVLRGGLRRVDMTEEVMREIIEERTDRVVVGVMQELEAVNRARQGAPKRNRRARRLTPLALLLGCLVLAATAVGVHRFRTDAPAAVHRFRTDAPAAVHLRTDAPAAVQRAAAPSKAVAQSPLP